MTNFIFCLIFLQVSIFFIATGILAYWICINYRQPAAVPVRANARARMRPRRQRAIQAVTAIRE